MTCVCILLVCFPPPPPLQAIVQDCEKLIILRWNTRLDSAKLLMALCTDSSANILRALLVFVYFLVQVKSATIDYHIAAVDIKWDYAPSGYNQLNGKPLDEDRYTITT